MPAPELAGRLAAFLAEITGGRPGLEVHAVIVEQSDRPDHDPRIDHAIADPDEFAAVWTSLVTGGAPSQVAWDVAWESVVLPAVAAFSSGHNLKAHLEMATSVWVAADQAARPLPQQFTVPLPPPAIGTATVRPPEPVAISPTLESRLSPRRQRLRPMWVFAVISLLLVGLIASLTWWRGTASTQSSTFDRPVTQVLLGTSGPAGTIATATATPMPPTASPLPKQVATVPAPSPTWAGPGPTIAPGPPTALAVLAITTTSISVTWQAPAQPGTGGIAYYRVFADGFDRGWTDQTSTTITGLTPSTTYTIAVSARNNAGLSSLASDPITVTTTTPPPPPPNPDISLSPGTTVALGDSFTVSGTNWTCSAPAQIDVLLQGQTIAQVSTDGSNTFSAPVTVMTDQPDPYINLVGGGQLTLTAGTFDVLVRLAPNQPQCPDSLSQTIQITFA